MLLYTTMLAYYGMHCLLMQAWPPSSATHSQVPMCNILLKHLHSSASHWLYTYYLGCHLMCNCCWFGIQTCRKSSASFLQIPLNLWKKLSTARLQQGLHVNTVLHRVQIPARIQSYPHPIPSASDSTHFLHIYHCTLFRGTCHYNPEIASNSIHCLHKYIPLCFGWYQYYVSSATVLSCTTVRT